MSGIGIITNPHSKLNKRNPRLAGSLKAQLGNQGQFFMTQSLSELDAIPYEFKKLGLSTLAICGGDGTISRAISAFAKTYGPNQALPQIALLRGGTMNLIASQVGQRGQASQILERLLQATANNSQHLCYQLRCLEIEGNYGFLYADGSCLAILEEFYRKKSGVAGACWLTTRLVASFLSKGQLIQDIVKPRKLKVSFGSHEEVLEFNSLGNLAGTISKLPLGFPMLPFALENSEQFQFTLITCPREKLLWHLPRIVLQQKKGMGFGKFSSCSGEVLIHTPKGYPFTLDGEIYQSIGPELKINSGPIINFLNIKL